MGAGHIDSLQPDGQLAIQGRLYRELKLKRHNMFTVFNFTGFHEAKL